MKFSLRMSTKSVFKVFHYIKSNITPKQNFVAMCTSYSDEVRNSNSSID